MQLSSGLTRYNRPSKFQEERSEEHLMRNLSSCFFYSTQTVLLKVRVDFKKKKTTSNVGLCLYLCCRILPPVQINVILNDEAKSTASSNFGHCFKSEFGGHGRPGKVMTSQLKPAALITRESALRDKKVTERSQWTQRGGGRNRQRMTAVFLRTGSLLWGQGSWWSACWAVYLEKTWYSKRSFSVGT